MTIQTMRDFGIGEGPLYIGGRWVDSASRDRREIENPKDESVVALVPSRSRTPTAQSRRPAKLSPSGADERRWSAARCFRNLRH
jgi:hypothetical protein